MVRMPTRTVAASIALAVALVLITMPLGGAVQASSPMDGWVMHDGGSARFEPNELPNPFVRDFDGDCEWWQYELKGGKYVRTYCLCKFGDAEIDYRNNVRGQWAQMALGGELQPTSTAQMPSTAGDMAQAQEETAAGTAGDMAQAMEETAAGTAGDMAQAMEETAAGTAGDMTQAMDEAPAADIVDTAVAAGDFETLVAAVSAAGLVDTLKGEGPFTVFAPTDEAFAALPEGTVDSLLQDPEGALTDILLYHVVPGKVLAADVVGLDGQQVETVGGQSVTITVDGERVMVDDANVLATDIETSNGVIHVIDAVLIPVADEEADAEEAESAEMPTVDIVDALAEAGDFSALLAAVGAADLADALRTEGPFTVFAPNDVAFMALPEGALDELLAEPSGALAETLLYHVVDGKVLSSDLTDGAELETLQGSLITVSIDGDTVKVSGVTVLFPDIEVSNGVVHVIEDVLAVPAE